MSATSRPSSDGAAPAVDDWSPYARQATCPDGPHRPPEGPNEDLDQCRNCWSISYMLRPESETFGLHVADCSLPVRHESYCRTGGTGHSTAPVIRGHWPELENANDEEDGRG